jgi:hypothetical protein
MLLHCYKLKLQGFYNYIIFSDISLFKKCLQLKNDFKICWKFCTCTYNGSCFLLLANKCLYSLCKLGTITSPMRCRKTPIYKWQKTWYYVLFNNIWLYINNRIGQQVIPTYMKSSPYNLKQVMTNHIFNKLLDKIDEYFVRLS